MAWRNFGLLVLLTFFGGMVEGQQGITFENYGIADGLSQSAVSCILEDDLHQFWIGTQEGLNRFDGLEFTSFQKENTPVFSNSHFLSGIKGKHHELWFGTKNGLIRYDLFTHTFRSFIPETIRTHSFEQIFWLNEDCIAAKTTNGLLFIFNTKTNAFSRHSLSDINPKKIEGGEGGVYVVGANNEIQFLSNSFKVTSLKGPSKEPIVSVFYRFKSLFYFTVKGGTRLDLKSKAYEGVFKALFANTTLEVSGIEFYDQRWYISTRQNGLFIQDKQGNIVNHKANIFQRNGLISNNINCINIDAGGVVWLGTDKGLSCFRDKEDAIKYYGPSVLPEVGLPSENVWSFSTGITKDELLIGTDVGISLFQMKKGQFKHFYRNMGGELSAHNDGSVMDIKPISNNRYLVACYDGLFFFRAEPSSPFTPVRPKVLNAKKIPTRFYRLLQVKNNLFLVGTEVGLFSLDLNTNLMHLIKQADHTDGRSTVLDVQKNAKGEIWAIFDNIGLCKVRQDLYGFTLIPSRHNTLLHSLIKEPLTSLIEPKPGHLFLGTLGSGILYLQTETGVARLITKKEGLPNNVVNGLVLDKDHRIWVSTNRGMACLNEQGKVLQDIEVLSSELIEYNTNAYFIDAIGRVYFGGVSGFNFFDPSKLKTKVFDYYPVISRVKLQAKNDKYPEGFLTRIQLENSGNEIELSYNNRNFEIQFQPNSLYLAKSITYKCVIVGDKSDTIYLGNTNRISLSSLAWGTYYLRIYSKVGNGSWTKTPALLTVTINPPFWASWPFWLVTVFIIFFLVFLYFRFKINQERREKQVLESLVMARTQEILAQKDQIERKNQAINREKENVLLQQKLLYVEKENAEKWLNNALPSQVVKELKVNGKVAAKAFESTSILFTDVVGFTKISESITPNRLVYKLDILFKKFDQIIHENNLEKIKTIGDAYMAVGGIPEKNSTHAIDACVAALQMQHYMTLKQFDAIANHKEFWEIRIGINTGPVTAGIIGKLKIAYDVWGSSVNQAQRMEMLAEPGSVTISGNTFRLVEPYFEFVYKGKAKMKSNALLDCYEVIRIKPELSSKGEGLVPNDLFYEIVGLHHYSSIKYYSAENELIQLLSEKLPKDLYYHTLDHTKDVVKAVERLALLEGVRDEGLFLLKTAALFHDAGFTEQYEHNEPIGARLAEEMLPKHGYSDQHIRTISELIFVTQVPHKPVNKLQEIMCDADLDYLGTDSFALISDYLRKELLAKGKIQTDREWDEIQVSFLNTHRYFTPTAIQTRLKKKKENLQKVISRLQENRYS
jgi:class 3 adenylate cyclase/ligand-binding sensor domain-containing protein/predicted metal-dependent HD superfamily phosphohydrolase